VKGLHVKHFEVMNKYVKTSSDAELLQVRSPVIWIKNIASNQWRIILENQQWSF